MVQALAFERTISEEVFDSINERAMEHFRRWNSEANVD